MKKTFIAALAAVPLLLTSCIADELPNSECDIQTATIHFDNATDYLHNANDTIKSVLETDSVIKFTIRNYKDVTLVPLTLQVTSGATIVRKTPDGEQPFQNGSALDFSGEQVHTFRVIAEDKVWSRNYYISIVHAPKSDGDLRLTFDDCFLSDESKAPGDQGVYYIWRGPEFFTDGVWKNGNPGFKISRSSAKALDYPSTPAVGAGPDGSNCLKLETCDTGAFGKMKNMRIASGSMFNGEFDVNYAITAALKATRFGSPFNHKPVMMRVWMRFEPGAIFQDRPGKPVAGVVDEPDAYVLLYRNADAKGNRVMLDGNDVLTNPHIIGKGRLPHHFNADGSDLESGNPIHGVTREWKEFVIPVEYTEEPDPDILADMGYSIVISFASSWQGAYFRGAIGSKLYIDNVQVICE